MVMNNGRVLIVRRCSMTKKDRQILEWSGMCRKVDNDFERMTSKTPMIRFRIFYYLGNRSNSKILDPAKFLSQRITLCRIQICLG